MIKHIFKVAVLAAIFIGLTPLPTQKASMTTLPPTSTCDFESCYTKCVKQGYLGGTCGSITHACVCYSYPPPRD